MLIGQYTYQAVINTWYSNSYDRIQLLLVPSLFLKITNHCLKRSNKNKKVFVIIKENCTQQEHLTDFSRGSCCGGLGNCCRWHGGQRIGCRRGDCCCGTNGESSRYLHCAISAGCLCSVCNGSSSPYLSWLGNYLGCSNSWFENLCARGWEYILRNYC